MNKLPRLLNAILILVLSSILLSAFTYQFILDEEPCPLCMLQRLGLIGIGVGAALNLRFGVRPLHYGLSILSALLSSSVSLRQISLHICPGFPTFGTPIFGLGLYTWAFLAAVCSIFVIAILLFLHQKAGQAKLMRLNLFEWICFVLFLGVTTGNIFTTFVECGIGPCSG